MQEATKLVFLFLRGSKPKRKVALAVNDGMAWTTFIAQVRAETFNTRVRTCSQLPSEALSAVPRRAAVVS